MCCLVGRKFCLDLESSLPEGVSSTLQGRACPDLAAAALAAAPILKVCLRRLLPLEAEAEAEILEAVLLLAVLLHMVPRCLMLLESIVDCPSTACSLPAEDGTLLDLERCSPRASAS